MEDYLRRAAIWPGAPVIDDPEGLLGEKVNRLYMFSNEPINRYCKRGDFFQEGLYGGSSGRAEGGKRLGLPVMPEGKMEERKRKYAAALHSVVQ